MNYNIDMIERRNYQKKNLKSIETQNQLKLKIIIRSENYQWVLCPQ